MPVVDKYRPVDPTPTSLTSPTAVLAGVLATAAALALFSADSLETWATFGTDVSPVAASAVEAIGAASTALGLRQLRLTLDDLTAPLDDTSRWFRRGPPELLTAADLDADFDADLRPTPVPQLVVPPGQSWRSHAMDGRARRVLIVGASSIQYAVGTELQRELEGRYEELAVARKGKVSTGLTRPDVFDWPSELRDLLSYHRPDLVIGQFGGNDAQTLVDDETGRQTLFSDGWIASYQRRVTGICDDVHDDGADLILLGMPVMRSPGFNRRMRRLDQITREAVEGCGGRFIPIDDLTADPSGDYRPDVRFAGRTGRMRMDDGIHFTRLGGMFVAHGLTRRLESEALLVPRTPDPTPEAPPAPPPAIARGLEIPSVRRGDTRAIAYVPREIPDEGLPLWLVLHGAWGSWRDWPDHAHDLLQDLAARHNVVIVTPDGEPFGWYLDSPAVHDHRLASWLTDELLPWLEGNLPLDGTRGITGNSMGGHGALTLAMTHPDLFEAASSMSGAVDLLHARSRKQLQALLGPLEGNREAWEQRSARHLFANNPDIAHDLALMLSCGQDDKWWAPNLAFHQLLAEHERPHVWLGQQGGHSWDVWTEALPQHAAWIAAELGARPWIPPEPVPVAPPTSPEPPTQPAADLQTTGTEEAG